MDKFKDILKNILKSKAALGFVVGGAVALLGLALDAAPADLKAAYCEGYKPVPASAPAEPAK